MATLGLSRSFSAESTRDPLQDVFIPPELLMQHKEDLGLSEPQIDAIKSGLEKLRPQIEEKQQALQQRVQTAQELLSADKINEARVMAQFGSILELENEMKKLQFNLMLQIRKTLSADQRTRAQKLKQQWLDERPELQRRIRSKAEKVQEGAQALAQAAIDPSEIGAIMDQVPPLMAQGRVKEAEELLDRALKLIEEKKNN